MNQDFISQTPLDQITGTDYGQMLKAAIPYLPARSRQILSIYEKAMEFRNTVSIFGKKKRMNGKSPFWKKELRIRPDCCKYCRRRSHGYA